ncbi:MAG: radical SAM protein [Candidatus Altiarchaeota archaeon]
MRAEGIAFEARTRSLCPVCLKQVDASVRIIEGKVSISKECDKHGSFESPHFWGDEVLYHAMKRIADMCDDGVPPDNLGLYLTQKCDLSCSYCYLKDNEEGMEEPSISDVLDYVSGFKGSTVILSGGEPTLRDDLPEIIKVVRERGYMIVLATNGMRLSREYVEDLKSCGLGMVMLSFTTFKEEYSERLQGINTVEAKRSAVRNLNDACIPLFLYIPVLRGVNDSEIGAFIDYAKSVNAVRAVDFNVTTHPGGFSDKLTLTQKEIIDVIGEHTGVGVEDFTDCTLSVHLASEALRKVLGGGRRSSGCYLRLYFLRSGEVLSPVSGILDLKYVNMRLLSANAILDSKSPLRRIKALSIIAGLFLSTAWRNQEGMMLCSSVVRSIASRRGGSSAGGGLLCINVMRFNDRFNADLGFTRACCSHSIRNASEKPMCACIREMYFCRPPVFKKRNLK